MAMGEGAAGLEHPGHRPHPQRLPRFLRTSPRSPPSLLSTTPPPLLQFSLRRRCQRKCTRAVDPCRRRAATTALRSWWGAAAGKINRREDKGEDLLVSCYYIDCGMNAFAILPAQLYSNTPSDFDFKLESLAQEFGSLSEFAKHLAANVDIVFPVIHGEFGEDSGIQVQSYQRILNMLYMQEQIMLVPQCMLADALIRAIEEDGEDRASKEDGLALPPMPTGHFRQAPSWEGAHHFWVFLPTAILTICFGRSNSTQEEQII